MTPAGDAIARLLGLDFSVEDAGWFQALAAEPAIDSAATPAEAAAVAAEGPGLVQFGLSGPGAPAAVEPFAEQLRFTQAAAHTQAHDAAVAALPVQATNRVWRRKGSTAQNGTPHPTLQELQALEETVQVQRETLTQLESENAALAERFKVLQTVLAVRDTQVERLRMTEDGRADARLARFGLSVTALKGMTVQGMAVELHHIVTQMADALAGEAHDGSHIAKVMQIGFQLKMTAVFSRLVNPELLLMEGQDMEALRTGLDDAQHAPPTQWPWVVSRLDVSPQQASQAWVLNELYVRWLRRLLAARARASAMLDVALGEGTYTKGAGAAAHREQHSRAVGLLDANLAKQRHLLGVIQEVLLGHIFTPLQLVQTMVFSYPYVKDTLGVLEATAALHARPSALAASMSGASRSGGQGAVVSCSDGGDARTEGAGATASSQRMMGNAQV